MAENDVGGAESGGTPTGDTPPPGSGEQAGVGQPQAAGAGKSSKKLILAVVGVGGLMAACCLCLVLSSVLGNGSTTSKGGIDDPGDLARLFAKEDLRASAARFEGQMAEQTQPEVIEFGKIVIEEYEACAERIEQAASGVTNESLIETLDREYLAMTTALAQRTREYAKKFEGGSRQDLLDKASRYEADGQRRTASEAWEPSGAKIDTIARWLDSKRSIRAKARVKVWTDGKARVEFLNQNEFGWTVVKITLNGEFSQSPNLSCDGLASKRRAPMRGRWRQRSLEYFQDAQGRMFGYTNARGIDSIHMVMKDGREWKGRLSSD